MDQRWVDNFDIQTEKNARTFKSKQGCPPRESERSRTLWSTSDASRLLSFIHQKITTAPLLPNFLDPSIHETVVRVICPRVESGLVASLDDHNETFYGFFKHYAMSKITQKYFFKIWNLKISWQFSYVRIRTRAAVFLLCCKLWVESVNVLENCWQESFPLVHFVPSSSVYFKAGNEENFN